MKYFKISFVLTFVAFLMMFGCKSSEETNQEYLKQGKKYLEKGEYRAAEIEFMNALQNNPEQSEVYENLGEIYLKQGNTKGAFAAFSKLAKLDPDNLDAAPIGIKVNK